MYNFLRIKCKRVSNPTADRVDTNNWPSVVFKLKKMFNWLILKILEKLLQSRRNVD